MTLSSPYGLIWLKLYNDWFQSFISVRYNSIGMDCKSCCCKLDAKIKLNLHSNDRKILHFIWQVSPRTGLKHGNFIFNLFKWILARQNKNCYLSFLLGVKVGNDSICQKLGAFNTFWNPPFYGVILLLEGSYWIRFYFSVAIRTWLVKIMQKPRGLQ